MVKPPRPGGFKPGHDPRRCTAGRTPGTKSIPDLLRRIGEQKIPGEDGQTKLDAVMLKVYEFALAGHSWAVHFIAERTEGKVREDIALAVSEPLPPPKAMTLAEIDAELASDDAKEADAVDGEAGCDSGANQPA